jgi:excisionase family DNA binding protein
VVDTATEELLSLPEAADRLGVSVYTVRRWIKDGKLRAFRPGKEYRIREVDLEEFLQAREVRPKGPAPSPYEPTLLNGLVEERRAQWGAAVRSARQLRERGRARMEELLAAWRDKRDRDALGGMAQLLDEARDVETKLAHYLEEEGTGRIRLDRVPIAELEEVIEASRFYGALFQMVQGASLSVGTKGKAHEVKAA